MSEQLYIESFIDGVRVSGAGEVFTLINPADETELSSYREAGEELARAAHQAALTGGSHWRSMTASARGADVAPECC